jgi:hypothetical protein
MAEDKRTSSTGNVVRIDQDADDHAVVLDLASSSPTSRTARASAKLAQSRPIAVRSSGVCVCSPRSTNCSMTGPSSRFRGDMVRRGADPLHAALVRAALGLGTTAGPGGAIRRRAASLLVGWQAP